MKLQIKIGVLAGVFALAALLPGTAMAVPTYTPGPDYKPAPAPPPPPPHAKAYGKRCQGKSKKHVKGEKGTEFSRCVRALKKAGNNPHMPPGRVCKNESKEHVKGEKGTAFSRCVKAVAHLRRDERRAAREAAKVSAAATVSSQPEGVPKGKGPEYTPTPPPPPGPKAGLPAQAKAYGRHCQGKSKKHVKGEQGTEFSRCVKAMAKVAANGDTPREACQGLSKKHVKGEQGTEFSRCVKAAAQTAPRRTAQRKGRNGLSRDGAMADDRLAGHEHRSLTRSRTGKCLRQLEVQLTVPSRLRRDRRGRDGA